VARSHNSLTRAYGATFDDHPQAKRDRTHTRSDVLFGLKRSFGHFINADNPRSSIAHAGDLDTAGGER